MTSHNYHNALPEGYKLHWFEIGKVIGKGGFGITYLANDENLNTRVAIKEYLPEDFATRVDENTVQAKSENQQSLYNWGLDRFITEARTLAKFNHPNIVRVLSVFEHNGTAYMVMEYADGEDLSTVYKTRDPFTQDKYLDTFIPIMDGLALIHSAGYIHRDIKPANIYICENDSPILLDFGSARQSIEHQTKALTSLVTFGYAPFEQYNEGSGKQGPWTDIYSLGASMYVGITGEKPVDALKRGGTFLDKGIDPYKPLSVVAAGRFEDNFLLAIDNALMFKADDRPQHILSWADMLLGKEQAPPLPDYVLEEEVDDESETVVVSKDGSGAPTGPSRGTQGLIDAYGRRRTNREETWQKTRADKDASARTGSSRTEGTTKSKLFTTALSNLAAVFQALAAPFANLTNKSYGKPVLGASVALVAIFTAILFWPESDKTPETVTTTQPTTPETVSATPPTAPETTPTVKSVAKETTRIVKTPPAPKTPEPVADAPSDKIQSLLTRALKRQVSGDIFTPLNDNAIYYFKEILKIDKSQKDALQALKDIHQQYIVTARQQINQQNYTAASQSLLRAETARDDDPLNNEIRLMLQKGQIDEFLMRANQALEEERFTSPSSDNAHYFFQQIKELDANNRDAKNGIKLIESRLLFQAETQIRNKEYDQAASFLNQVDHVNPKSKQAAQLRKKIAAQTGTASKTKTLLAKADQQFKKKHYTSPKDDNAYDTYRQVLAIDANNKAAKSGISKIKNFYKKQFNKHIAANQVSRAQRDLTNLEKIAPRDRATQQMKITLQNKKKALQKPQKSEIEQISDLMGEFKKQLESRNVAKIEKISQFIPGREKFVDQLTANYKKLSVKITNFQYIAQKQHATADIELTNLVDKNGQLVKPASWSKFSIKIAKDSRKQYKIHW